jgi:hypothetical protein
MAPKFKDGDVMLAVSKTANAPLNKLTAQSFQANGCHGRIQLLHIVRDAFFGSIRLKLLTFLSCIHWSFDSWHVSQINPNGDFFGFNADVPVL